MKLLVTGASGFLGRYVVAEALRRGHDVRAMVRPASDLSQIRWRDHPRVELVRSDLRAKQGLGEAVSGVDAVLHLAAAKTGDVYAQLAGTVVATENLLEALTEAGGARIVGVSSFSAYDYRAAWMFSRLDETTAIEDHPEERDAYCQTKLIQERLICDHAERHQWKWTILRPGVIYGKDNLWTARLGIEVSPRLWIRIGAWARLPLAYVENCAEAVVLAAEREEAVGQVLNVVDDVQPTQRRYVAELRRRMSPPPRVIPLPYTVARSIARLAWLTNRLLFRGRAKVPSIFVPASLHARCKPLRYSNQRLREVLGWKPRYEFREALDRVFNDAESSTEVPMSYEGAAHAKR
jgi:nucleoside-diphosphate-sugar epimerase